MKKLLVLLPLLTGCGAPSIAEMIKDLKCTLSITAPEPIRVNEPTIVEVEIIGCVDKTGRTLEERLGR